MSSFKSIANIPVNDKTSVSKYRDERTGLTVVLVNVEGPLVRGYFVVPTEVHDDDGIPHTLEHLIFNGSEKYPQRGLLMLLANKCLASAGAFTATNFTCYTLSTVGSDGFLTMLPIFLDHILNPVLNVTLVFSIVFLTNLIFSGYVIHNRNSSHNWKRERRGCALLRNAKPDK